MADSPASAQTLAPPAAAASPQPKLPGLASVGIHTSSPKSLKRGLSAAFEPPTLTGAAALADEKRRAEDAEEQARIKPPPPPPPQARSNDTSPNPVMASINALRNGLGISQPFSRPSDAASATTSSSRPALPSITSTTTTAEPMSIDQPQTTSPTSMSSADGLGSKAATALNMRPDDGKPDGSSYASTNEERPNRALAMTYPGPLQPEPQGGPQRQMSLPTPGSSSKSPNKKHKCPHCSTEFTRHHNLKSHLLTHSQEKPYACSTCHSRFRRLHDLKRHNKLHTGERPHTCDRCGRRFARGDALARHNKGPGGCAGRRSSMDEDYIEGESGYGDGMEGVVYQDEPAPGQSQADFERRKSEPGNRQRLANTQTQSEAGSSPFRQHSSTYPGPGSMASQNRNQFAQPLPSPQHLTPSGGGASSYSAQLNNGPGVLVPGGMTESPKPLSPGQTDSRRLSAANDPSYFRGRSPSHPQHYQPAPYSRGAGRGTPPVQLPPPIQHSHAPQLPPLDRLAGGPSIKTSGPYAPVGSASNPGSASSAHQSSGSSLRELYGVSGPHAPADANLYEHVKSLQAQVAQLKEDNAISERHYETKIARLADENRELRAQLTAQNGTGRP
ncbi:hypothetical protein FH972_021239 [Carpinus fangiana]|uniref:C2H2-type domain-containing protein n=1 Tax=Carpinus fangiana TaxID=176857 RepID=A0A5N6KNY8_9ROSI|nr:hypothetical protein FH972_021239 [Carpinus fangiana]